MRVLIVDDEEEICQRLKHELQKEEHEVDYTTSSIEVLKKLSDAKKEESLYQLLLLDLRIPKVSGFELLREIRKAHLDLDVIIITGYGDEDKALEAIRLGAIDYLRKPISLQALRTAIFRVKQKATEEKKEIHNPSILVVDDEKELCARIKRELEKEGYRVAVAYDGLEGLKYFKNNHVDVAIVDIRMPKMSGLEMLEKCKQITNDFVSIIITGFGDHERAIRALQLGVFDYLRKPISLEELIVVVEKGIDNLMLRRGLLARTRELEIETTLKTQYSQKIEKAYNELKQAEEGLKVSLKEKEVLLQEIHHRVKNNMQLVHSLINLQSRCMQDKMDIEVLKEIQNQVRSMHLIHEKLYQSKDLANIDFNEYLPDLVNALYGAYEVDRGKVESEVNIKDISLGINVAIPCGLIINELVSNSLKYAFPEGREGKVKVALYPIDKNEIELVVSDNGVGIPKDLDFRKTESLGLHLVTILAENQLDGRIELDRTKGTKFKIKFKVAK